MMLFEAMLMTLYIMGGKSTTQFILNIQLFLVYKWLNIHIKPLKFIPTRHGPLFNQHKFQEVLDKSVEMEYTTCSEMYVDEVDKAINSLSFYTQSYYLTDKGVKYVK